jgi:small subunit ribosomal protein S18
LLPPDAQVDYKDVALLRRFISDRGRIRSRRITGISPRQQRAVTRAIKNAREMALLPYHNQPHRKEQP